MVQSVRILVYRQANLNFGVQQLNSVCIVHCLIVWHVGLVHWAPKDLGESGAPKMSAILILIR